MISLIWRFIGDNSPLKKTLGDTARASGQFGGEAGKLFGQQFKSAMLRFIGAGALIGTLKKGIEDASRFESEAARRGIGVEAAQELQRAAGQLGLSVDELLKAAPFSPQKFEEFMTKVRESGGILDQETVQLLVEAGDQLNLFTRNLAPILTGAIKGLNGIFRFLGASGAQIQGVGADVLGFFSRNEELKTRAQVYYQTARDIKFEGVATSNVGAERAAGRAFLREAQRNQQQGGSLKETNDKLDKILRTLQDGLG